MRKELTVEELIYMEKDYIYNHRILNSIINNSHPYYHIYEGLFTQKHISIQNKNLTNEYKHELSKWHLTKFEMLMLLCYLGNLSEIFDDGDPIHSLYPINEMCKSLDTVLIKAPSCNDVQTVYRQCRRRDDVIIGKMKEGDIQLFDHYLTTSINNWNQDNHQYVINISKKKTNGRSLYKIRNKNGENQVTFKRNTKFKVTKIEIFQTDNGEFKRFYLDEQ